MSKVLLQSVHLSSPKYSFLKFLLLFFVFLKRAEHQFLVEEIFEDLITGRALTGPLAGEYGEPDIESVLKVLSTVTTVRAD